MREKKRERKETEKKLIQKLKSGLRLKWDTQHRLLTAPSEKLSSINSVRENDSHERTDLGWLVLSTGGHKSSFNPRFYFSPYLHLFGN